MTPEQLQAFRDKIACPQPTGNSPVEAIQQRYDFPRGWNECLEFVNRSLREVLGEAEPQS